MPRVSFPLFLIFFNVKVLYVRARRVARVRRNEVRSEKSQVIRRLRTLECCCGLLYFQRARFGIVCFQNK